MSQESLIYDSSIGSAALYYLRPLSDHKLVSRRQYRVSRYDRENLEHADLIEMPYIGMK